MGIFCITQGTQAGARWQPRGDGMRGMFKWEGTWVDLWFMLMFGRNLTQYCKAIILQLKISKYKWKKISK